MPVQLMEITNLDPGFYRLVGPFLARRDIARALGGPAWDDDGKTWFVALDGAAVVGFAATIGRRDSVILCSAYVLPAHRRLGIYRQLLRARIAAHPGARFVATATDMSRPALASAGFRAVRPRGRFTVMEMASAKKA